MTAEHLFPIVLVALLERALKPCIQRNTTEVAAVCPNTITQLRPAPVARHSAVSYATS